MITKHYIRTAGGNGSSSAWTADGSWCSEAGNQGLSAYHRGQRRKVDPRLLSRPDVQPANENVIISSQDTEAPFTVCIFRFTNVPMQEVRPAPVMEKPPKETEFCSKVCGFVRQSRSASASR